VLVAFALPLRATSPQAQHDHLAWMLASLPNAPRFTEWQQRTGEQPPDFDAFPRNNVLPDPLAFMNGRTVRNASDWTARRTEIRQQLERWQVGRVPPKATTFRATVQSETPGPGYVTRVVQIEYGPQADRTTTVNVTLTIPEGAGPFPVMIGGAASSLIRRGYIACSYSGSVDAPGAVAGLYPEYDFASMGQVAFTIQTVVDHLLTVPQVDKARIAITGYSRAGKMALIAAALDERIAAVVAGSTGVGGVTPWRLSGEYGMGEGVESTTRSFPIWFHPRLRFFSGKEDRLPVDGNLIVAMVAPRAILIQYGLNDEVTNTWSHEQVYDSARKVFSLLRQPDRIGLLRVPGFHGSNDVEASLDWLDIQFGRSRATWDNKRLFEWSYARWLRDSGEKVDVRRYPVRTSTDLFSRNGSAIASTADWERAAAEVRTSINEMLGEPPGFYVAPPGGRGGRGAGPPARAGGAARGAAGARAGAAAAPAARGGAPGARRGGPAGPNPGQLRPDVPAWVIQRGGTAFGWVEPGRSLAAMRPMTFGYGITGHLYYPNNTPAGTRLPAVVWLHGYSYPLGYMWVYRTDTHPILALVNAGYAVLAFDQAGFGSRMGEFAPFYDRHPRWSLMGRMVEDTTRAVDALVADAAIDPERISVFGYTIGGTVGLYAAALDPRIRSVVSISGFTPMRSDTADRGTGGLARYSEERALLPRLGVFIGNESRLPYDFDEVIAAIAPRSVLVVEPTMDRATTPADVREAVTRARTAYALYSAADKLALYEPVDYTRLTNATQDWAVGWMNQIHRPSPVAAAAAPVPGP
jgi:dienelactone hydrolase